MPHFYEQTIFIVIVEFAWVRDACSNRAKVPHSLSCHFAGGKQSDPTFAFFTAAVFY